MNSFNRFIKATLTNASFLKQNETFLQLGKKDFKKSVDLFGQAIKYDSSLALFYVSRGAALLKLARARDAKEGFDRAIALDAGYARAYHLRGIAHEQMGNFARAFQDFDRALEIDPEYGAAYPSRESMLSNPKQPDPALEEEPPKKTKAPATKKAATTKKATKKTAKKNSHHLIFSSLFESSVRNY